VGNEAHPPLGEAYFPVGAWTEGKIDYLTRIRRRGKVPHIYKKG